MTDTTSETTQAAQFFGLELFRGKPLSAHLTYIRQQIAAILGSDMEFGDDMRVELETLEIALGAFINRAKKQEQIQPNRPLVSWKRIMDWRHIRDNTSIVWGRT